MIYDFEIHLYGSVIYDLLKYNEQKVININNESPAIIERQWVESK